ELNRFDDACDKSAADLRQLFQKIAQQIGEPEAEIFRSHEAILRDPALRKKVRFWISERKQTAKAALARTFDEYRRLFTRVEDSYLRERLADVQDVLVRVGSHLAEVRPGDEILPGALIVVAREILPSQALSLGDREVAGFVTQVGGKTGHAAIIARSRGVPAIAGVESVLTHVKNNTPLIVDGRDGTILINPDPETEKAYLKLQREFVNLKDKLAANRDQPAVSADGEPVRLLANINGAPDAKAATAMGAAGVGLYRTEYLFLTHPSVPDEEEQFSAYREVVSASPGDVVVIRTLDIGGDKTLSYFSHQREANPFMGFRSIRLSFRHPEFFLTQIRAVLRAAACGANPGKQLRLLFPMVTNYEEVKQIRRFVDRARAQLAEQGVTCGEVPIGIMVEVPSAAISIRRMLPLIDFVSIGSNDLVQYLMAADRDNPLVAHLCQPLSPAVLTLLNDVVKACIKADKPITICGEMAGSPRAFVVLYGMGVRRFSMSPAFVPTIKDLTRKLTRE
ncbi:MAG TPA: phosphoenolpyruvate--protein phosphotransferase, partial [Pirellulales bacterium]